MRLAVIILILQTTAAIRLFTQYHCRPVRQTVRHPVSHCSERLVHFSRPATGPLSWLVADPGTGKAADLK